MDYDMGFLKYASLAYQEDKKHGSINLDSYDGSYHNNYPPAPSSYENNYPTTNSTYRNEPRTNTSNLQRGLTFGEENPGSIKDRYQSAPYPENYTLSYNVDQLSKNVYDSYKPAYDNPPPVEYDRYDKDYE